MIQYALRCENGHGFEGWFGTASAYDAQAGRGLLECPHCGSRTVEKALMTPAVARRERQQAQPAEPAPVPASRPVPMAAGHPDQALIRAALKRLRAQVESAADYVGPGFAEEARRIHFGEADRRGIYGEASLEEVERLVEDGIDVMPLPVLPEDHN